MVTPYQNFIDLIVNGTPVDAATTNVPISQLAGRTDALKQLIDLLAAGESIVVPGVTLDANLPVGSPLYLGADGIFHLAQTALAADAAGGVIAASSFVKAVLFSLASPTTGTVIMGGRITGIPLSTWNSVVDTGTAVAGHYWLSAVTPGLISQTVGPLEIYIGQLTADGTMYLGINNPNYGAHQHFHFVLSAAPAGTVVDPGVGDPQTISSPDTTAAGWLPAAAPYFPTDWIPAGASFGYNFGPTSAAALKAAFPPIPNDGIFGCQGGETISSATLVSNDFGLWWIPAGGSANSAPYGTAPWPVNYVGSGNISVPIDFFFVQVQAATDQAIVTSLGVTTRTVLPITFVDESGAVATGGRLRIDCPSILAPTSVVDGGNKALKSITGGASTFGPVVGHLIQGAGVTLASTSTDATGLYGDVVISAASADALQGSADLVSLNYAAVQFVQSVSMATLMAGRNATPVFSLNISSLAPPTSALRLSLWLYSTISGNIPSGFTIQYRIVPPPSVLTNLPTGWSSLAWTMTTIALGAGQSQVVVAPLTIPNVPTGAVVLVQVTRNGSSDGFGGDIGIIRMGYALQ